MKRGFLGYSKKKSADSRTIRTVHPGNVHPDTVHPASIDTVHLASIDTVHPNTVHHDTVHPGTAHLNTVHPDTVHLVKNDTTCLETEKIEVLILKVDENGMLRDEEGRTRNNAGQLINAQGAVIPDVIAVAVMNDFDLSREWDEQHVSGKLSKVEEAGTENATSTSIDDMTSTSPDGTTSTSTYITTSTSINVPTSSSIDDVDIEVTMEDSSELEEWLKDIDQNSEKKLDDDQHTSRGDLETSKASIDQHQPDEIDRQPPHIIDLHPPDID
ncbi:hypothetical protein YC2023_051634 [Brassica napus]